MPGVPLAQSWPDTASGPLSPLAACPRLIGTGHGVLFSQCQQRWAHKPSGCQMDWAAGVVSVGSSLGFSGGLVTCWAASFEASFPGPLSIAFLSQPKSHFGFLPNPDPSELKGAKVSRLPVSM